MTRLADAFHYVFGVVIVYAISFILELNYRWSYIPKNTTFIPKDVWPEVETKKTVHHLRLVAGEYTITVTTNPGGSFGQSKPD